MASNAKERLAALSDEQRQVLARRLVSGRAHTGQRIVRRAAPADVAPLSFAQQRIWFLHQVQPLNTSWTVGRPIRLRGPLNLAALTRSLNEIIRRHESLRTIFPVSDGVPSQKVLPFVEREIPVIDLRRVPESSRRAELVRQIAAVHREPWVLETGPLLRSALWRLADDDHLLLLLVHHILADGWAWGIAERELTALYQAFSAGEPSPLPELPIQYADFAVWQRNWIGGAEYARQLEYWKTRFSHPPKTQLVADAGAKGPAVSRTLQLSEATTNGLRTLCRREGATLFMGLTAVFGALLARYTGDDDLAIGSPIANRNRVELEPLIGCFMNPLPLRIDASGDPSFSALLRRVRDVSLGVYANQDVPFDLLVRAVQPDRDPSVPPLFQAMLLLQNFRWEPVSISSGGGAAVEDPAIDIETLNVDDAHTDPLYPFAIEAYEHGASLRCLFQFERAFATMLGRASEHFERLLEGALANPDRPVTALPLLTDDERRLLVPDTTARPHPPVAHRRFEEQAARQPEAIAVVSEEGSLSYAALNANADRLSHLLCARGIGADASVAVLLPRSADLIVSLLGVLKAGAAYVPLDPAYPADRLRFMLADSGARLLVTTQTMLDTLPRLLANVGGVETLRLDADAGAIAAAPSTRSSRELSPATVAYVIYTSGSTGTPKGVQITHAALGNYTDAAAAAFDLTPADRVLQFASISFDTAAEEIYPCLASGATLVLRTAAMIQSAPAFFARCEAWGITVLDLPTAYWHELTGAIEASDALTLPASVRLVILGGERARPDRARAWQARFGARARLLNTYGPTEATIVTTMFDVPTDPADPALVEVPIGRPIPHARAFVLDRRQQLQTIGAPGELCIGGVGLSRGYVNRPDLTADRFVPDPFSGEPGARLYRTGDRVRRLEDGTIEFLGRLDHQVKLRGYRIELAEIEMALMKLPAVRDAVVVREDAGSGARLVAYVVARSAAPNALDLRRALRDALPAYMIPSAFVMLDALPLTPSGKIDRDALPAADRERDSAEPYAAPDTSLQAALASIWRELLGVERVGLDDNFFDLGGHSLLVLQLHSRLGQITAQPPSIVDLFRYPTVRALAEQLAAGDGVSSDADATDAARDRADRQRQAFRRRRQVVEAGAAE